MVPDGQRRPSGDPAGRTVVAHGRQCFGGALRQAEQPGCVRQRHLLPGLDTPTDEGEYFKLTGKLTSDPSHAVSFLNPYVPLVKRCNDDQKYTTGAIMLRLSIPYYVR